MVSPLGRMAPGIKAGWVVGRTSDMQERWRFGGMGLAVALVDIQPEHRPSLVVFHC